MRLGLCCLFKQERIHFRTTTAKVLSVMPRATQLSRLSGICLDNAGNLLSALKVVRRLGIGAFRITSQLFPRMTHPDVGYTLEQLPDAQTITVQLAEIRSLAAQKNIRLSLHPDQFVVLSSPHEEVMEKSLNELERHAWLAGAVGADVVTIHAGGTYGDKIRALQRFEEAFTKLSQGARNVLAVENDDKSYTVRDLLPLCEQLGIPLVYDVHHHRCNPDGLSVEEATRLAGETWLGTGREQYCHISSPRAGWTGADLKPHADYIDPADFPHSWLGREMTVDVEAKAKELAVRRLMDALKVGLRPGKDASPE